MAIIDDLQGTYGFPAHVSEAFAAADGTHLSTAQHPAPAAQQEFVAAGGIDALVHVATTGWPADGGLTTSRHPYDNVVAVNAAARQHEHDARQTHTGVPRQGARGSGPEPRSARRRAIVCLANMARSR